MKKIILLLSLTSICFFSFIYIQPEKITTFYFRNDSTIINKGYYNPVLIAKISFLQEGLTDWMKMKENKNVLFLIDTDVIERSESLVQLLIEEKRQVGLLLKNSDEEQTISSLQQELTLFQNAFQQLPIWVMREDGNYSNELKKVLFKKQINAISPSITIFNNTFPKKLEKGAFVAINFSKDTTINLEALKQFQTSHTFSSIQESLFRYSIETTPAP